MGKTIILIDPGHGRETPGKRLSDSTLREYEFNRGFAKLLNIQVNGKWLPATGLLQNGVSWLPIRAIAEAAGGTVGYNAATKQITVNGKNLTERIDGGTGYAFARELANILSLAVEWNGTTKNVNSKGGK